MRCVKNMLCLLCCLSLFACSSREPISSNNFASNGYAQGYVSQHHSHSKFLAMDASSVKKSLSSDHQLMMSLLYRPMTEDQAMMLAFAQERASYSPAFSNAGVMIKGAKTEDQQTTRAINQYAHLIAQDINAVLMTAPQ